MNKLKRRVLLELLERPLFLIPATIGASLLLLSVAVGGSAAFWGVVSLLVGCGALASDALLNMTAIIERATVSLRREKRIERDSQLDVLDEDLVKTKGTEDQESLRHIRQLYDQFYDDIERKKIDQNRVSADVLELIDQIFDACIEKLALSYSMYQQAAMVKGEYRDKLLAKRREMLGEIDRSIEALAETINTTRVMTYSTGSGDLKNLRLRLETQLSVAKATEEMLGRINGDDLTRFSEYETNNR